MIVHICGDVALAEFFDHVGLLDHAQRHQHVLQHALAKSGQMRHGLAADNDQICTQVEGHEGIADSADDAAQSGQNRQIVRVGEETIAPEQSDFDVDARQQFANASDFVEPVAANFLRHGRHIRRGEVVIQLRGATLALSVLLCKGFLRTVLQPLKHHVTKFIQRLRHHDEDGRIKLRQGGVREQLGDLNRNLQTAHTFVVRPGLLEISRQLLDVIGVLGLGELDLLDFVYLALLERGQASIILVEMTSGRSIFHPGACEFIDRSAVESNIAHNGVVLKNLSLAVLPRGVEIVFVDSLGSLAGDFDVLASRLYCFWFERTASRKRIVDRCR
mmetsp:Transcript_44872/g.78333  ORF Transcript_44872/g.78333 Transcript_44872/m.78333 type:complete len:331 (-) Transcript_44872:338-1330(-)